MPVSRTASPAIKRPPKKVPVAEADTPPGELIARRIAELQDWRGEMLSRLRTLITAAHRDIAEEWKWNVPVWSCSGIVCTGETYKKAVKLTFAKGASLKDPSKLFNSSLDGNTRRAIDFFEDSQVDESALRALIQSAVTLNKAAAGGKPKRAA
jgi:hypothetical protein